MINMKKVLLIKNPWYQVDFLSHEAIMRYAELKGIKLYCKTGEHESMYYTIPIEQVMEFQKLYNGVPGGYYWSCSKIKRDDKILIKVVEEMGKKAVRSLTGFEIVEIPTNRKWIIQTFLNYDYIHLEELK